MAAVWKARFFRLDDHLDRLLTGCKLIRITPPASRTVKNHHWGDLVRGLYEAYDRDSWLAILPDGDGLVTEGAGFNVFAVIDRELHTPARGVLLGITRRTVIEIAGQLGLPVHVGDLPVGELYRADELFLTSTAGGVMPVATLDGQPVGIGNDGRYHRQDPHPVLGAAHRPGAVVRGRLRR